MYNYTFTHNAVHHILNHKEGNAGGNRVQTHDRVVRAVAQLCKDVGLVAEASAASSPPTPCEVDATSA